MSGADGATNRSVAKKFNRIYPDREPISHTTIGRLILKFRETGSVLDKPKSGYSRVSDETRRRVIEKVESSSMKSIRRSSSELGVPRTIMRRIIKAESFHPYKLNCFICFGALFMAQNVCYYYLNCFICFGALFMAHPVYAKHRCEEMFSLNALLNALFKCSFQ